MCECWLVTLLKTHFTHLHLCILLYEHSQITVSLIFTFTPLTMIWTHAYIQIAFSCSATYCWSCFVLVHFVHIKKNHHDIETEKNEQIRFFLIVSSIETVKQKVTSTQLNSVLLASSNYFLYVYFFLVYRNEKEFEKKGPLATVFVYFNLHVFIEQLAVN